MRTTSWGSIADWLVAIGTFAVALIAAFQDRIRAFLFSPRLNVSIETQRRADCHQVPFVNSATGAQIGIALYCRLRVQNDGPAPARAVEVYARQLERQRADGTWEIIEDFLPMNLTWPHGGGSRYPLIPPKAWRHCDLGHVSDPAIRQTLGEQRPALGLQPNQVSFVFETVVRPSHLSNIVGPGHYRLSIETTAENANRPVPDVVDLTMAGPWYPNEDQMLRDGIGVRIL